MTHSITTFPCQNGNFPTINDNWLFHYTNAESFFKIIETMQLKTSRLTNLNDLNEININTFHAAGDWTEGVKLKNYIEKQCAITCFAGHSLYPYKENNIIIPGAYNPCMWAHYANNLDGVCLCFNRNKLEQENMIDNHTKILKSVNYGVQFNNEPNSTISAKEHIESNLERLFFHKDICWSYESETRLLIKDIEPNEKPPMISIANSLELIVFGPKFIKNNLYRFLHVLAQEDCKLRDMHPHNWELIVPQNIAYRSIPLVQHNSFNKVIKEINSLKLYINKYLSN